MKTKPTFTDKEFSDLIPEFELQGMNLKIERMQKALKSMGNPCAEIPAIQIVGTNGKGSIASFIKSSLKVAGIKAGVTTSPHLLTWCERICTDGDQISPDEFRQRLISVEPIAKEHHLTPFELVMAAAFQHFSEQNIELLVLEAGLGGRLDATTAHPLRPVIAMASIGLDHCEYLGRNLKDITKEKAAVISAKSSVISASQHQDATEILEATIKKHHANMNWVSPLPDDWDIGLNGKIQRKNAAVAKGALQALEDLGWKLEEEKIREGIALTTWPGRLQNINWEGMPLIIDGAHNPHAAEQLSTERTNWKYQDLGVHWILGIQKHKMAPQMLRYLLKPFDIAWIVPVPHHESWTKEQLSHACPDLAKQLLQANEVEQVLNSLRRKNLSPNRPTVITGSLYLIGAILVQEEILKDQIDNQ